MKGIELRVIRELRVFPELMVIPELAQKEEWIRNAREEREREDLSRLLHIKKKKRKWRE